MSERLSAEELAEVRHDIETEAFWITDEHRRLLATIDALEREKGEALAVVEVARDIVVIMDQSEGVAGWHLNGEVMRWEDFDTPAELRRALAALPTPVDQQKEQDDEIGR